MKKFMNNFLKYLTVSEIDEGFGLYLTMAGKIEVPIDAEVSKTDNFQPSIFSLNSEEGRVVHDYQVHFVKDGHGILETESGSYRISPGTVVFICSGESYRFKLYKNSWSENYFGFKCTMPGSILAKGILKEGNPVFTIENSSEFERIYQSIFDLVLNEKPGFQIIASGIIINMLGNIVSSKIQEKFTGKPIHKVIQDTQLMLRNNYKESINIENIAVENNIGYSYFRKMFKKYTGISPKQYLLQLKIKHAKELLLNTDMSVGEISNNLGFYSIFYFSRIFKAKTGLNPSDLRRK